ncbi:hypothetical protein EWF20_13710 [Sulfolobus sp. S-194]|uniref:hypothetical protein n=1 Tax=Sulfolobus sp. S-194 TaxID=2512240 RepID=UPI001436F069|nr:hypothetical protein [Sulfolobus sp. S-194]QIW25086.1 hypothetical protein EWF20_13710 [Sulfolobus sp. S-194]
MQSVELLMEVNSLKSVIREALDFSEKNNLVPLISFYLEDDLLKKIVKTLDSKLKDIFKKYNYNRDLFIKEARKILNTELKEIFTHFIYYAIPISEKTEIMIIKNNWIPPRAVILNGKVRFTFMPYSNIEDMEKAIKTQNDDDIIVEFENGIVKSYDRKRNIFTDFRSVTQVLQSRNKVSVNLFTSLKSIFHLTILSNNVYPYKNKIEINIRDGEFYFNIIQGKATKDDVINGATLTAESKAELYYDYKKNSINKEIILNGLIYKLPDF